MAAAGGRRMVQKESQAALEERESERSANPAAASGASLAPPAAAAPGEDNPSGAGAAAVSGAAGGTRRFLCGVVEGELAFQPRPGVQHLCVPRPPGGACRCFLVGLPPPQVGSLSLPTRVWGRREKPAAGTLLFLQARRSHSPGC